MEPYAVHLLCRFKAGETVEQLVVNEGVPPERIIIRLKAARNYERAQKNSSRPPRRRKYKAYPAPA